MNEIIGGSVFYGALVTLLCYEAALLLRRKTRLAIFNPILMAAAGVMGLNGLLGVAPDTYQQGAAHLTWLLTPATVCLAVPLYEQMSLLKKHLKAVVCGLLAGVAASLAGVWLMSLLFGLDHQMYVTLLPKSVTSAIGMGVAQELGGIPSLTVGIIILTGILGHLLAEAFFRLIRVTEPVARGLAMGTAAHAIGTARALEMGPVEGAMSSLAIAAAGLLTALFASLFAPLI